MYIAWVFGVWPVLLLNASTYRTPGFYLASDLSIKGAVMAFGDFNSDKK
jgi:hypothetical protein